jgi:L-iditol 2-dehydrogenase
MPGPFGHQYAGTVSAVGEKVRAFEPGVSVWGVQSAPCGECAHCRKQRYSLCPRLQDELAFGAFAQYFRLPARVVAQNLLIRPSGVSARHGAFLEPVSCVVHAIERVDWRGVDRVLVLGLGSMGLLFCQLLARTTNASVVAMGRNATRVAIARGYGLEQVVDISDGALSAYLSQTGRFDCVIEATGQVSGWRAALEAVHGGGQALFFGGLPKGAVLEVDSFQLHYQETRLLGSFHFGPPDVRRAAQLLEQGALQVDDLISGASDLEGLENALRQMEAGKAIKYAIDPWASTGLPFTDTRDL